MKSYVYFIANIINGRIYVGKSNDPLHRWHTHKCHSEQNRHPNVILYKAFRKYGIDNFRMKVIEEFDSVDEALDAEIWLIDYLKSLGCKLYNLTLGGEGTGGYNHSEETKRKISIAHSGKSMRGSGWNHSDDTKKKMSESKAHPLDSFNEKFCRKCESVKSRDEFSLDNQKYDKKYSYCKLCKSKMRHKRFDS